MASIEKHKNHPHISAITNQLLPGHIANSDSELLEFAKTLIESLEEVNKSGYYQNRIDLFRDIDEIDDDLLTQLQAELGAPIPRRFAADPRLLYKHVTELYKSRGTPDSIRGFFKLLFDDDVEIYFPKEDMLIPSDGRWFDQSDDIIANPSNYTPLFTYTIGSTTDTVSGNDDAGRALKFDNPLVYVNNDRKILYDVNIVPNESTGTVDYSIVFPEDLQAGDVVNIYRTGSFSTNDGFVDDDKKIQDSYFYQKFSYVLRTGSNADTWKNPFNRLVHPAGFIFFGEILLLIQALQQGAAASQPGFQLRGLPFQIVINPVDTGTTFVKTRTIGGVAQTASYYEKEHKVVTHSDGGNYFGQRQYFERFKFLLGSPISDYSNYTVQDAINNNINFNMTATIELSN